MSRVRGRRMQRSILVSQSAMTTAAVLVALSQSHCASAANATWNGSVDPTWANGANWTPSPAPGAVGVVTNTDTALFNSAGNGDTSITIDSSRNIQNITFDTASAATYTFTGGILVGTNGGEIQMTPSVIDSQTFIATFSLKTSFTFANNAASPTAALNYSGSINSTTGSLTLTGSNTGSNSVGGSSGTISCTLVKTGLGTWTITGASATSFIHQGMLQLTGSAVAALADGGGIFELTGTSAMSA